MIKFDAFVAAIQEAIVKANESLIARNTDNFVETYFDHSGDEEDLQDKLDQALKALKGDAQQSTEDRIKALSDAKVALTGGDTEESKDADKEGNEHAAVPGSFSPKLVTLQFPFFKDGGIEYRDIHVPLITLMPISSAEINEVTLETDIVISESDDEVHLNFERKILSRMFGKAKPGRLKIKVSPREPADGLQIVLDGYEKLLRSQMPQ